ncbi:MAG: O-antigen ligase domain-containing protein [Clostridia bacterium]|nr:O-antigen ligase domain-containing protein [Clostridia bacterium]
MIKCGNMESKSEWLTDKYILLMLAVFPLWTGLSGYSALTVSKFSFFAVVTGLWFMGLIVCFIWEKQLFRITRTPQWGAVAFILAACASALFSPYGGSVIIGASRYDGLITLVLYGGIFLGVSVYGRPRKTYVYALALSTMICCLIALSQLRGNNPLGLFPGDFDYYDSGYRYSGAFLGTIGNTDVLAALFCLTVPLFTGTAVISRDRYDAALLIPAALCLYVLIRSDVSSGILAIGVCALFSLPYLISVRFANRKLTLAALALSAATVATGLIVVWNWRGTEGTVYEFSQIIHGNVSDSFGSSRILIWREALDIFRDRPFFGGGPDTLTLRTDLGFSRYVAETGITLKNHIDNAHNEYLNYLVNIGILGFLPYLLLIGCSVSVWLRHRYSPIVPALGCALICYWVQSFFGLGLCIIVPLVWIFMGLINAPLED